MRWQLEEFLLNRGANGAAYGYIAEANNPLVKVFQEAKEFEPAMCN